MARASSSLALPTMEMPNGVITHHNRPPSTAATGPTTLEEGRKRRPYNVRARHTWLRVRVLPVGWRPHQGGEWDWGLAWPTLHIPPSLSARPFTLPHSVTHLTTVTATAEYDGCPIITDDTVLPPRHGTLIFFCVMCPTHSPSLENNNIARIGGWLND